MRPAADVVDPVARRRRFHPRAQHLHRLLARIHTVETQLFRPGRRRPQQMHVVVDQPGDHRLALQVDPARIRTRKSRDLLIGARRHDAIAPDRHRLRDRKPLVDRDDLPVGEDQIRLRAQRRCEQASITASSGTRMLLPHHVRSVLLVFIADEFQKVGVQLQVHDLGCGGPGLGVRLGIVDGRHQLPAFRNSCAGSVR